MDGIPEDLLASIQEAEEPEEVSKEMDRLPDEPKMNIAKVPRLSAGEAATIEAFDKKQLQLLAAPPPEEPPPLPEEPPVPTHSANDISDVDAKLQALLAASGEGAPRMRLRLVRPGVGDEPGAIAVSSIPDRPPAASSFAAAASADILPVRVCEPYEMPAFIPPSGMPKPAITGLPCLSEVPVGPPISGKTRKLKPDVARFNPGCLVRLISLVENATLNGVAGVVTPTVSKWPGTVEVQLQSGQTFSIRPVNLIMLSEEHSCPSSGRSGPVQQYRILPQLK